MPNGSHLVSASHDHVNLPFLIHPLFWNRSMRALTPIEHDAMTWLLHAQSLLVSRIPDKTETDVLGGRTPGRATFKRLEKLGLCYETDEDLMDPTDPDMGTWTPSIELTAAGQAWRSA
jgi:hypothetical protein